MLLRLCRTSETIKSLNCLRSLQLGPLRRGAPALQMSALSQLSMASLCYRPFRLALDLLLAHIRLAVTSCRRCRWTGPPRPRPLSPIGFRRQEHQDMGSPVALA